MSDRVLPRAVDGLKPLMVIPTYGRAGRVATIKQPAFADQQKLLLVHNQDEYDAYEMIQDLTDAAGMQVPLVVTDVRAGYPGSGKARQMEWVWDQLDDGEFIIFADDDLGSATWLPEPHYSESNIEFSDETNPEWSKRFGSHMDDQAWNYVVKSTIHKMVEQRTILGGFATVDNYFFRGKHWRRVGYVSGHMMIMRKDSAFKFDLNIGMEDYRNSAEITELFGSVVLNNYAYFKHSMYIEGGLGTVEERRPYRRPDCDFLIKEYPGFFRIKESGIMAGADLSVALTDRTVDRWVESRKQEREFGHG